MRLDVAGEVFADVVLVPHQLFEIEGGGVVEELLRLLQQERLGIDLRRLALRLLGQHGRLGGLEHAVEPAQHGEWQNDPPILGLLVISPQQIGDRPNEGGQIGLRHGGNDCWRESGPQPPTVRPWDVRMRVWVIPS